MFGCNLGSARAAQGVCACRPRRDCSHSPGRRRNVYRRAVGCAMGRTGRGGCPRPGARGGGRRSVAQDPLLVPEADRAVALNDRRDVCVAVGPCVGVGDGQVGPARRANWLGHHVSQHPLPSVLLAADDHPNLLQNRSSSASTGPPPGSVITDEASPLALRSTRNRLRNQPSGRPGPAGVLHRLCRRQVRGRGLDRVACPRGRSVRDPHDAGRAGLFRTELLSPESTNYAEASIDDYAERTNQTVAAWKAMNGQQGGDPAKLATALVQLASRDEPPRRWVAGVDAGATVEQKAKDLLARPTPTASCPATSPTTTPELTADRNPAGQPAPTQVPARAGQRRGEGAERTLASRDASAGRLATWRDRMGSRTAACRRYQACNR